MKRLLAGLLPMLAAVLLLAGSARADAAGPGSCFGGNGREPQHNDASGDAQSDIISSGEGSKGTRRLGAGFLSAAFVTSGWLFLRRRDRTR